MISTSLMQEALISLGRTLTDYLAGRETKGGYDFRHRLGQAVQEAGASNPWFTKRFVHASLSNWAETLSASSVRRWLHRYPGFDANIAASPQRVAVVMAGNIPLVGLHDMLCVLVTGNHLIAKMSSDDACLLPVIGEILTDAAPGLQERMVFTTGQIKDFNAVIATGSDNSARYFEYYFGRYPHLIRRSRNSIAVLDGNESFSQLDDLCSDIFDYFGMGCRSVSKLFVPEGYDFSNLTVLFDAWDEIGIHHKYRNNYDYRKAVMLIGQTPFIDHRNLLIVQNTALSSPLAVLHYEEYRDLEEVTAWAAMQQDKLQCVVCNHAILPGVVSFGQTQKPSLWDYADGADTIRFLMDLKG